MREQGRRNDYHVGADELRDERYPERSPNELLRESLSPSPARTSHVTSRSCNDESRHHTEHPVL